jgi:hypothetical protein
MRFAGLAQLVEHLICNQGVTGSSPVAGTRPKFFSIHDNKRLVDVGSSPVELTK